MPTVERDEIRQGENGLELWSVITGPNGEKYGEIPKGAVARNDITRLLASTEDQLAQARATVAALEKQVVYYQERYAEAQALEKA